PAPRRCGEIRAHGAERAHRVLVGKDRLVALALRLEEPRLVPLPAVEELGRIGLLGGDDRTLRELQRVAAAAGAVIELCEITERCGARASIVGGVGGLERLSQDARAASALTES